MSVLCLCAGVLPALRPDAGDTAGSSGSGDERLTGTGRVDGYAGVTEDDDGTEAAAAGSGEAANGAETAAACTGTALAGTGAAVAGAGAVTSSGTGTDAAWTDAVAAGTGTNSDGAAGFLPVNVGGWPFYARLDGNLAEVYDLQLNSLFQYRFGDEGTVAKSSCISDLDRDGTDEVLLIAGTEGSEYGTHLVILGLKTDETSGQADGDVFSGQVPRTVTVGLLYKCDMADINPWKVQTCDVDGDGRTEISIGVYKTARFHPVMAKRPFIYEWHGNAISPKWLGSRLSRPFDDYIFADINADGVDEIISIEHLRDGRKAVNSYSWKGFGFEGIGESTAFDDIYSIGKITPDDGGEELIEVLVLMERQKRRVILRYGEERLEYSFADTGGAD